MKKAENLSRRGRRPLRAVFLVAAPVAVAVLVFAVATGNLLIVSLDTGTVYEIFRTR